MKINGINGNTYNNNRITPQNLAGNNGSIFLTINDNDGNIDLNDIQFSSEDKELKKLVTPFLKFLNSPYNKGKEWNGFMTDSVNILLDAINNVCEDYNGNYHITESNGTITMTDDKGNNILEVYIEKGQIQWILDSQNGSHYQVNKHLDGTIEAVNTVSVESQGDGFEALFGYNRRHSIKSTYRDDKSLYEKEDGDVSEIYDRSGHLYKRITKQRTPDGDFSLIERYRDGNVLSAEYYQIKRYGFDIKESLIGRVIYDKDGNELTVAKYEDNKLVSYTDNRLKDGNEFFEEEELNGSIDCPIKQGLSGVCYIVGIINSMFFSKNPQNLEDLNAAVTYDFDNKVEKVELKGLGLTYEIPMADIEAHMTRLGLNDPDFPAIALAYEKYLLEYGEPRFNETETNADIDINIDTTMANNEHIQQYMALMNKKAPTIKEIDGGSPADFYFALTGKHLTGSELNDDSFNEAKESLANGGIVNAGTAPYNIYSSDNFMASHNYSVLEIDEKKKLVILYEPTKEEYKRLTIAEFKREFSSIFYS